MEGFLEKTGPKVKKKEKIDEIQYCRFCVYMYLSINKCRFLKSYFCYLDNVGYFQEEVRSESVFINGSF